VFGLAFCIGLVLTVVLIAISGRRWLVDNPGERKLHKGRVPLVGGISLYLAGCVILTLFLFFNHPPELVSEAAMLYVIALPLIIVGMLDDQFDIHPIYRLMVQIGVSYLMIEFAGQEILKLGDVFGTGNLVLGSVKGKLFTSFCVVGVINAINMIDGVDGLSSSLVLVSLLSLAWVAIGLGAETIYLTIIILLGTLSAFLLLNLSIFGGENRVFLGDAGSMFLGFALVWLLIEITQSPGTPLSPIAAGWLFGVPLIDAVSVMVGRVMSGKSPLNPDRDHIHHKLLKSGFSARTTLLVILMVQLVFIAIGFIVNANRFLEFPAFWSFVALVVLHFAFTGKLIAAVRRNLDRNALQLD